MLDTWENKFMNRVLVTQGKGLFEEQEFTTAKLSADDILVKNIMTGVCRSDIDMMMGTFGPLPVSMQGHEGLGKVIAIGDNVIDVEVGNYVATRGEPAYADMYIAKNSEYVRVPSAEPKYIIEPVACGMNLIYQPYHDILKRSGAGRRLCIIGSGFLAWVAYNTLKLMNLDFEIDVIGSSNQDIWSSVQVIMKDTLPSYNYDVIIDLNSSTTVFDKVPLQPEGLLILGTQKTITTDFGQFSWRAATIVFPSPRSKEFYTCMSDAVYYIQTGKLMVDKFWTKGYNRDTEWQQAFADGLNRPKNYSRGYIYWN